MDRGLVGYCCILTFNIRTHTHTHIYILTNKTFIMRRGVVNEIITYLRWGGGGGEEECRREERRVYV